MLFSVTTTKHCIIDVRHRPVAMYHALQGTLRNCIASTLTSFLPLKEIRITGRPDSLHWRTFGESSNSSSAFQTMFCFEQGINYNTSVSASIFRKKPCIAHLDLSKIKNCRYQNPKNPQFNTMHCFNFCKPVIPTQAFCISNIKILINNLCNEHSKWRLLRKHQFGHW